MLVDTTQRSGPTLAEQEDSSWSGGGTPSEPGCWEWQALPAWVWGVGLGGLGSQQMGRKGIQRKGIRMEGLRGARGAQAQEVG